LEAPSPSPKIHNKRPSGDERFPARRYLRYLPSSPSVESNKDGLYTAAKKLYQPHSSDSMTESPHVLAKSLERLNSRLQGLLRGFPTDLPAVTDNKPEDLELTALLKRGVQTFAEWEMLATAEEVAQPRRLLEAFAQSKELEQLMKQWPHGLLLLDTHRLVLACTPADRFPVQVSTDLNRVLRFTDDGAGEVLFGQDPFPFIFAPLAAGFLVLLRPSDIIW
jgi:hypothetical protein